MEINYEEFLEKHEKEFKLLKSGYLLLTECPFCFSKKKFNLNVSNPEREVGFINCFKCGKKGGFYKLFALLEDIDEKVAYARLHGEQQCSNEEGFLSQAAINKIKAISLDSEEDEKRNLSFIRDTPECQLPKMLSPSEVEDAFNYLKKRGLSDYDIAKTEVMVVPKMYKSLIDEIIKDFNDDEIQMIRDCVYSKNDNPFLHLPLNLLSAAQEIRLIKTLSGRVVFPLKIGKKTLGYVARDYTGEHPVKVKNSVGALTSNFFWNYNNVFKQKNIVILEGIFSAIACGVDRSLATLGKNVSTGLSSNGKNAQTSNQIFLLKSLKPDSATIFYDPGAYESAAKLANELAKEICVVRIVKVPTVLKIKGTIDVEALFEFDVEIEKISENQFYVPYTFFRFAKIVKQLLEIEKSRGQPEMWKRYKAFFKNKSESVHTLNYLSKNFMNVLKNKSRQEILQVIASGDYLDANDFGSEICSRLIDFAMEYDPNFDYTLLDTIVIKIPNLSTDITA